MYRLDLNSLVTTLTGTCRSFSLKLSKDKISSLNWSTYISMFYGDDVCKANLKRQLQTFALDYPDQSTTPSIFNKGLYEKSFTSKEAIDCRSLHCIKINTVMPASNATSEHIFSALRRVKTYLRSTTRQDRLNHVRTG